MEKYADIIQIGTRNMQNFSLLRRAGHAEKPVMLKRGMAATMDEWLMAAEYILDGGNENVILWKEGCGLLSTTAATHWTCRPSRISAMKAICRLSSTPAMRRATRPGNPLEPGRRCRFGHGLMVEVHHAPDQALSDGAQSLYPEQYDTLCRQVEAIFNLLQADTYPGTEQNLKS